MLKRNDSRAVCSEQGLRAETVLSKTPKTLCHATIEICYVFCRDNFTDTIPIQAENVLRFSLRKLAIGAICDPVSKAEKTILVPSPTDHNRRHMRSLSMQYNIAP